MLNLFACLGGLLIILLISELIHRNKILKGENERKFVHICAGTYIAFWPWLISWKSIQLIGIAMIIVVLLNRSKDYLHILGGALSSNAAHSTSSSRDSGKSRPFGVPPTAGPSARRAAGSWRSSAASRAGTPDRRRRYRCRVPATRSPPAPCSSPLEPLLGRQAVFLRQAAVVRGDVCSPSRSDSWRATRSAMRRVLTKTSVVRWASTSRASRS